MKQKTKFGTRFGVFAAFLFLVISSLALSVSAQGSLGSVNDIDVSSSTEYGPTINLYKESTELYGVRYSYLLFEPLDQEEMNFRVDLSQVDWETHHEYVPHEQFPHIAVRFESPMDVDGRYIGTLHLTSNVFSSSSVSEITFSFTLEDIPELPEGKFFIVQEILTPGSVNRSPGDTVPGKEPIEFFELSVANHKGYYSWSTDARVDGTRSNTEYISGANNFFLGVDYNPEVDQISIESIELENTMMGSSVLPVPEPISRLPSILVGILIGSSFIVGVAVEKRREFYKNRDTTSVVRLEDSPYYKGRS